MYIEVYLFYASFVAIVVLLSYKTYVVRRLDMANQNHVHFDTLPKFRVWVLGVVHKNGDSVREKIFKPLWRFIVLNVVMIKRGAVRLAEDARYGRKKMGSVAEKSEKASGYIQKIIDQKKRIKRNSRRRRLKF